MCVCVCVCAFVVLHFTAKNDCLVLNASDRCGSNGSHMTNTSRSPFIGCPEQDAAFALAYMIVTAVLGFGSVVVGQAQRTLGMRVTRLVCGWVCLCGVSASSPDRYVVSLRLGNLQILLTETCTLSKVKKFTNITNVDMYFK